MDVGRNVVIYIPGGVTPPPAPTLLATPKGTSGCRNLCRFLTPGRYASWSLRGSFGEPKWAQNGAQIASDTRCDVDAAPETHFSRFRRQFPPSSLLLRKVARRCRIVKHKEFATFSMIAFCAPRCLDHCWTTPKPSPKSTKIAPKMGPGSLRAPSCLAGCYRAPSGHHFGPRKHPQREPKGCPKGCQNRSDNRSLHQMAPGRPPGASRTTPSALRDPPKHDFQQILHARFG